MSVCREDLTCEKSAVVPSPLILNFIDQKTHECGAAFFATLAYPNPEQEKRRTDFEASLCNGLLKSKARREPWEFSNFARLPDYLLRDDKRVQSECNRGFRLIAKRRKAAEVAVRFLEFQSGVLPSLPNGARRLSLNEVIRVFSETREDVEPDNFETDVWRPSRPAIHLALAFECLVNELDRQNIQRPYVDYMIDRELVEALVRFAGHFETLISASRTFPIPAGSLIPVRVGNFFRFTT